MVGLHTPRSSGCTAIVVDGLSSTFNLKELSISCPSKSVQTGLEMILKRAVSLEVLSITGKLSLKDSVAVGDFIEITFTLKNLVLDDCSLEGIEVIAKALLSNKSLERLILNNIHSLTGEAAGFLAQFITVSNTLQHFEMDERTFRHCGLKELAQISCCNSKLESPSHTSWRREFSSCKSRKREFSSHRKESPYNYPQGRKSKYQIAELHSSPSQFNIESNIHRSWRGESPIHQSGRWQSTCIQPESSPTQATSSQINRPPTNRSRPHPHPHPQPTQHSAPQPATNQTVQDSMSPLDQYIDYVKTVYKKSEVERDTRTVKWPPTPSKVYINLVSINRKMSRGQMSEYNEVTKAMVQHGDVDVVHGKK